MKINIIKLIINKKNNNNKFFDIKKPNSLKIIVKYNILLFIF